MINFQQLRRDEFVQAPRRDDLYRVCACVCVSGMGGCDMGVCDMCVSEFQVLLTQGVMVCECSKRLERR